MYLLTIEKLAIIKGDIITHLDLFKKGKSGFMASKGGVIAHLRPKNAHYRVM